MQSELARRYLETEGTIKSILETLLVSQKSLYDMFDLAKNGELEPAELNAQVVARADEVKKSTIHANRRKEKTPDFCKALIESYVVSPLSRREFIKDAHVSEKVANDAIEATREGAFGPELKLKLTEKIERNLEAERRNRAASIRKARAKPAKVINHEELARGFISSHMSMTKFASHSEVSRATIAKVLEMAIEGRFGPALAESVHNKLHPSISQSELKSIADNFLANHFTVVDYCNQINIDMATFNRAMELYAPKDWVFNRV